MGFTSLLFLFVFLPCFFSIYFLTVGLFRTTQSANIVALLGSVLFFAWGAPGFVFLLLCSMAIDYVLSHILVKQKFERYRKPILCASIFLNLGFLFYFKYSNFFVEQLNLFFAAQGASTLVWTQVLLPIGISFITFEKLSYIIDVYRGTCKPADDFIVYSLFIFLFPHLIAGPIFRYHDLASQLLHRTHSPELALNGLNRFVLGLAKKVLIADTMAIVADGVFNVPNLQISPAQAWIGAMAYAFQIYFDFSGYSDMAIGLGRVMGFQFAENFNNPYIATNITDFWRRWHISLSNWLREYLYYPLGGSRVSSGRMYINLWIVFLVSGFWHGAAWTFILWGAYHGLFLVSDKLFWLRISSRLPKAINIIITFIVVLCGWVLFRADTLAQAGTMLGRMFYILPGPEEPVVLNSTIQNGRVLLMFAMAALISFCPGMYSFLFAHNKEHSTKPFELVPRFVLSVLFFFLSVTSLVNSNFSPFIYFRF